MIVIAAFVSRFWAAKGGALPLMLLAALWVAFYVFYWSAMAG
jgi:hypothetical protein